MATKCRSCGEEIIWIKMKSGKAMPCDVKPIPYRETFSGGMKLVTPAGDVISGNYDGTSDNFAYISHFATCPNADQHRRKKNGREDKSNSKEAR